MKFSQYFPHLSDISYSGSRKTEMLDCHTLKFFEKAFLRIKYTYFYETALPPDWKSGEKEGYIRWFRFLSSFLSPL